MASLADDTLVTKCQALLGSWRDKICPIIESNRDAYELDITVEEARDQHIVSGNETYIGRRVIADNIARETPTYLQYLAGSRRHVAVTSMGPELDNSITTAIETEFTEAFRVDGWMDQHLQALSSFALHGRGVFMVIDSKNKLGTKAVYVPPEDFAFPLGTRDLQKAPMVAVRYSISVEQFKTWKNIYGWTESAADTVVGNIAEGDEVNKMIDVHLAFFRFEGVVHTCWYSQDSHVLLRGGRPFRSGAFDEAGAIVPATLYPFFPVYYSITENPKIIERKGRAHADMHDQEALTMGWTAIINSTMRASELYIARKDKGVTENPEVTQTDFIIEPGKVLKSEVTFFNPPWPDAQMLSTLNALKTENSSSAGQVDFAAQARKDSRKTAKELSLAEEQTAANKSVPLTMFATGYKAMLSYQFEILQTNMRANYNTTFLANNPAARQALIEVDFEVQPAGDVDYVERNEQLKLYLQLYPLVEGTAVGNEFLRKIIELAFPKDYQKLAPLIQDNSRQMLGALVQIMRNMPMDGLPPELQAKLQEIIAAAQQSLQPQGQNAPTETAAGPQSGPGGAGRPQTVPPAA